MIIVKTNLYMKSEDLKKLRLNIQEQMKTGLIVLQPGFDAIVVDDDTKVVFEWEIKKLQKDCYLYKAAFEKACELLASNSKMDMHEWFHHLLKEVGEEDD